MQQPQPQPGFSCTLGTDCRQCCGGLAGTAAALDPCCACGPMSATHARTAAALFCHPLPLSRCVRAQVGALAAPFPACALGAPAAEHIEAKAACCVWRCWITTAAAPTPASSQPPGRLGPMQNWRHCAPSVPALSSLLSWSLAGRMRVAGAGHGRRRCCFAAGLDRQPDKLRQSRFPFHAVCLAGAESGVAASPARR